MERAKSQELCRSSAKPGEADEAGEAVQAIEIPERFWVEMYAGHRVPLADIKSEVDELDELVNKTCEAALGVEELPDQLPTMLRLGPLQKQLRYQQQLVVGYEEGVLEAEEELYWRLGVLVPTQWGVQATKKVVLALAPRDVVLASKQAVEVQRVALRRAEKAKQNFAMQLLQLRNAATAPMLSEMALKVLDIQRRTFNYQCELNKGQRLVNVRYRTKQMALQERYGGDALSDSNTQKSERAMLLNQAKDVLMQEVYESAAGAPAVDLLLQFAE
jgi:hypothetical protein